MAVCCCYWQICPFTVMAGGVVPGEALSLVKPKVVLSPGARSWFQETGVAVPMPVPPPLYVALQPLRKVELSA